MSLAQTRPSVKSPSSLQTPSLVKTASAAALLVAVACPLVLSMRTAGVPLEVLSIAPSINAMDVAPDAAVSIRFNQRIDIATVTDRTFHVFGNWSGITPGALVFSADGTGLSFKPEQPFSAGEKVIVTLARTIESESGDPMSFGYCWSFWVDSRSGSSRYTNVQTLFPGDTPYGGYGGDLDGDEDLDICTPNENSLDVSVFLNDGTGSFSFGGNYDVGLQCSPSEAADFDFDGKLDLAVANIAHATISVLFGNGDGTFQPQVVYNLTANSGARGLATLDVDGDGDNDLVAAQRNTGKLTVLTNDGSGVFSVGTPFEAGVSNETGVSACDMDNDGIFDLVVIGINSDNAVTLIGDGDGGFTPLTPRNIGNGPWMVVTGDLNGDGYNDAGAANSQGNSTGVVLNDGTGNFGSTANYPTGSFPLAIDFGDLSGDGFLDMTASCYGGGIYNLFRNDGDGTFTSAGTLPAVTAASCTILHDTDNDGDLDITGIDELADRIFIFRQDG